MTTPVARFSLLAPDVLVLCRAALTDEARERLRDAVSRELPGVEVASFDDVDAEVRRVMRSQFPPGSTVDLDGVGLVTVVYEVDGPDAG